MDLSQALEKGTKQMAGVPPYPHFVELAQKFLRENEGEDSGEMLVQNLGRLLSVVWDAGKILQSDRRV